VKTPLQLTMAIAPAHRNQYLFSDHYLNNLLPQDPRWDAALPEAEAFLTWLQVLYAKEQDQLADYNEAQLETHWFRPILTRLGHVFEGQAGVPGLDAGVKRPDYVFFPGEDVRQAAAGAQSSAEYTAEALAVGEVKRWNTPLGKKRRGGGPSFENQNPSWQIDYYLRATNLDWGILTDGRLWRLVHRETSQRLAIYYEVDLVELLGRSDAGAMRYFTLFFRQAAFRPDAQGRVFLDDALAASNAYAVALEEDLKENVYRALEWLMQGFLDLPANGLGADDLREIYDNSLYLLYRLLFILYGESRGLLPMENEQYREQYSLQAIEREIAIGRAPTASLTTVVWGQLKTLFHIINGDDAELNRSLGVPRYNGGLFDPRQHPFLDHKAVGDRALGQAIDLLSRRTTEAGREFVDYRSLGVRHLGSIYEGLLEYRPRIESSSGQVYLETDRGERKATGSYYTPQYIVAYIVGQTLGPLVEEASERANGQPFVDAILDLKVLDPAMGSGHFLVEATEFLALALAADPYVETGTPAEEDLTHWKRRVVERCIYGVDKNPLAVELAKLSLWLATVAADKPLSFLDHHLKCGDSLVGARVDDLGEVPPVMLNKKALRERKARYEAGVRQANLFETRLIEKLPVVMGRILEITEVESKDYDTVRAKEAADRAVQQLKAPFQAVADLWTSGYFGNRFINGEYDEALMHIGQPDALLALPAVQRARAIAGERRFFHWELEFPEVFFDRFGRPLKEQAGFDVVVGNPPYGSIFDDATKDWARQQYQSSGTTFDAFAMFLERATQLATARGAIGEIVPSGWLTAREHLPLRTVLLSQTCPKTIVHMPYDVFPDAYIDTIVWLGEKSEIDRPSGPLEVLVKRFGHREKVERMPQQPKDYQVVNGSEWFSDPQMLIVTDAGPGQWLGQWARLSHFVPAGKLLSVSRGITPFVEPKPGETRNTALGFFGSVGRYALALEKFASVVYDPSLMEYKPLEFFTGPRLIIRRIISRQHRIHATLVREHFVISKSYLPVIATTDEYALAYALAILNSKLLSRCFVARSEIAKRDDFPQLDIATVREFPIRRIVFTTPQEERERLLQVGIAEATEWIEGAEVTSASSVSFSAFSGSNLGRWLDARLTADPEQSDVVHDLLAHLAERMIEMHKQKQARVEDFWLDLEGVAADDAFAVLRHKGKQERTLWRRAGVCRPFVSEESRSTRRLDESLAWNEEAFKAFVRMLAGKVRALSDLVSVYRVHSPAYRELVARIAATDWLIDQLVYRLYGLTEEEIAIVEGTH